MCIEYDAPRAGAQTNHERRRVIESRENPARSTERERIKNNMTIQEAQNRISEFCKKHELDSAPEYRILDAVSELGEVAKEMLKMTDYGKQKPEFKNEMKSELGDLFYSIITIANTFQIDLDEALEEVLIKYERRLKRGGAGSEHD